MILFITLAAAIRASRTECLQPRRFPKSWRCWLLIKWLKASLRLVGSGTTFDGAEMNLSLVPLDADIDEPLVVVTSERV